MARVFGREDPTISNEMKIVGFLHCMKCLEQKPKHVSPEGWARLNFGVTEIGVQVWCVRHGINVLHIDFEGHQHPVCTDPRRRS